MVKVVNDSPFRHTVYGERQIVLANGKKTREIIYSRTYVWEPQADIDVPKEDFEKMINEVDHLEAAIYTKKQWRERTKLMQNQEQLKQRFFKATGEEQENLRKQLLLPSRERYLILNALPHEA